MKKFWMLPLLLSLSSICQASPWIYPDGKYKIDLPQGWPEDRKSSQRWSPSKDMFCQLSAFKQSRQEAANSVLAIQQSYRAKRQGQIQVTVGKLGNLDTWLVEAEPSGNAGHITIYYLSDGTTTRSVYLKTSADSEHLKQERAAIVKSFSAVTASQAKAPAIGEVASLQKSPTTSPAPAPSDRFLQCQAEFCKAFDEAADVSERGQATEAYSYKIEKIRPHSDSENGEIFLRVVASRVNAHASEAGSLLTHCKFTTADMIRRAKEQNLLVPEALQSVREYSGRLVKEFEQERDAQYHHQPPPARTTLSQADQLQRGWAYRQGQNQYLVLQRTAFQQYRVEVQEFQPHPDPKKPQVTPSYSLKEVTMTGEELLCGQRIKNSAVVCSRCKGAGSLNGSQQDKGGPHAIQGRSMPIAQLSDKQFSDCKPCGGSGLIVNSSKPAAAPAVAAAPKRSAAETLKAGNQASDRGGYAEAIRLYQETLRYPGLDAEDRSVIHSAMGVAYASWGKESQAFSEYNIALSEYPKNPVALYNRAYASLGRRHYQSALRDLEAAQLCARTPEQSSRIKQQLTMLRDFLASEAASNNKPSGAQYNGSGQGMGGWKDWAELNRRSMETLERTRRENLERAYKNPNRKY